MNMNNFIKLVAMNKTKYVKILAIVIASLVSAYVFDLLTDIKLYLELFVFSIVTGIWLLLKNN